MIAAGKEDIRKWFIKGVELGACYMLVVYDRMDYPDNSDAPYYAYSINKARSIYREFSNDPMCEVMEVYDLCADMEAQLAEKRAMHLPEEPETKASLPASGLLSLGKTRLDYINAKNKAYIRKYFGCIDDVAVYYSAVFADDDRESVYTTGFCLFSRKSPLLKTAAAVYRFDEDGGAKAYYVNLFDYQEDALSMTFCHAVMEVEEPLVEGDILYIKFELRYTVVNRFDPEDDDEKLLVVKRFSLKPGSNRLGSNSSEIRFLGEYVGDAGSSNEQGDKCERE